MKAAKWKWVSALLVPLWVGCGTPGVPQPPSLNLAKPVSDLKATRTGNQVTLAWTVPTETTDGAAFRRRGTTRACMAVDQPAVDRCNAIATLEAANRKSDSITRDLPTDASGPKDYATYAVEVDNDRDKNAGLSNQVQVPIVAVSKLNGTPAIRVTQDAVLATATITPRAEILQQILELRRKEKGKSEETTVARRVLDLPNLGEDSKIELRDDSFAWEKTYNYRLVLVAAAKVPNGQTVAFDATTSAPVEVVIHDIFPPAVPTGVQAVSSGQFAGQQPSIDLTWNPDSDRDLAGYFVYRRRQDEPASAATKLNSQPVSAPAYRDAAIQPGNTYIYSVSAVDERGNESKRSEETSEQAPK